MTQCGPKQYPKPLETFKVGDLVRRKGRDPVYEVVGFNDSTYEALCRSKLYKTESWLPMVDLEKYETLVAANQIDSTLQQRGSRYGSFNDLAQISQALKETMRAADGWNRLTASQREALEMVQHKVARMLNGDPTYEDNAVDIVGYSTLMLKNMQGDLKI